MKAYNFIAVAAMTVALCACSKDGEELFLSGSASGSGTGGSTDPVLKTAHVAGSFTAADSTAYEVNKPYTTAMHEAWLENPDGKILTATELYKVKTVFELSRYLANIEANQFKTVEEQSGKIVNGEFSIGKNAYVLSNATPECGSVTLYGTTYNYPELGVCQPQGIEFRTGRIVEDKLPLFVTVAIGNSDADAETLLETAEIRFELTVVSGDEVTVNYTPARVVARNMAKLQKQTLINGNVSSSRDIFIENIEFALECGEMLTISNLKKLDYGQSIISENVAVIEMNIISFSATVTTVNEVSFVDEETDETVKVPLVWDTLTVEKNGVITVEDNSTEQETDLVNTAYFKLVCDGIDMAEDTKLIRQTDKKDISVNTYTDATVTEEGKLEVTKVVTVNDEITSTKTFTFDLNALLECGDPTIVGGDLTPLAYGEPTTAQNGSVTVSMNITNFTAVVGMPTKVSFTDEETGETIVKPVVYETLTIESNGEITTEDNSTDAFRNIKNTAHFKLVCDGVKVAEDDKIIFQRKSGDKREVEYGNAHVTPTGGLEITKTVFVNQEQTAQSTLNATLKVLFECGDVQNTSNLSPLGYGSAVTAHNGNNEVAMNIVTFTAVVGMPLTVTFFDEEEGNDVTVPIDFTTLTIESNGNINTVDNTSGEYHDIMNTAYFKLLCDGVKVAEDDKKIHQSLGNGHVGYEWDIYPTISQGENGSLKATLTEYETKDGNRTGVTKQLETTFTGSLSAGEAIIKQSDNSPSLASVTPGITGNKASFIYLLDNQTFGDEWTITVPSEITFTGSDGTAVKRRLKDRWIVKSVSFTNSSNIYSNKAELSIAGFVVSSATQQIIIQPAPHTPGWEFDDYAKWSGGSEVTLKAHKTVDGHRTGESVDLKKTVTASLQAGPRITKQSSKTLSLSASNADYASSSAQFSYTLGGHSFKDSWTVSVPTEAQFETSDGTTVTKPISAVYSVRSKHFSSTEEGLYSNEAALYADAIEIATGTQEIKVEKPETPTYPGYTLTEAELSQAATTMILDRTGHSWLVVFTARLTSKSGGDGIMIHHAFNVGNGDRSKLPQDKETVGKQTSNSPYSMEYSTITDKWTYGYQVGTKKGTKQETDYAYACYDGSRTQLVSTTFLTDKGGQVVWFDDSRKIDRYENGEIKKITVSYNGESFSFVPDNTVE